MAFVGKRLVDQVRKTGVKATVAQRLDDGFTRFTTGISWNDVRGILRGDPPPKPNSRVYPHTESFWFHIRPTFYHEATTSLYPTFRLGLLSALFFVLETITGLYLMVFYTPSPERSYQNMLDILTNVPFGSFVRDLHRLGAEVMVVVVVLHMLRTFITGSYKKPRQFVWFTGVVLLVITLFLSFSGYLLPWDQLAYWAVTIGTSMADAAPVVGPSVNLLLRGAPDIGASGLLRFYLFHVILFPLIGFIFLGVHYYKVVRYGLSLPPHLEKPGEDSARKVPPEKRVNFLPDIATNELIYIAIAVAVLAIAATTNYNAPLETHSNPLVTPNHTVAPWYFYWLQGLLKIPNVIPGVGSLDPFFANLGLTPKVFWGVVMGPLVFVLLFAIPYIDPNPSRRYSDRKVMLGMGAIFMVGILYLSGAGIPTGVPVTHFGFVGGSPASELAQEFMPDEGESEIVALPFEEMVVGDHEARPDSNVANAPHLTALLRKIGNDMEHRKTVKDPNGLLLSSEGTAFIKIGQVQPEVKRVTIEVNYTDEKGAAQKYTKDKYVHRDADHE